MQVVTADISLEGFLEHVPSLFQATAWEHDELLAVKADLNATKSKMDCMDIMCVPDRVSHHLLHLWCVQPQGHWFCRALLLGMRSNEQQTGTLKCAARGSRAAAEWRLHLELLVGINDTALPWDRWCNGGMSGLRRGCSVRDRISTSVLVTDIPATCYHRTLTGCNLCTASEATSVASNLRPAVK
jgi:hypothetical protein